jgi:hypothetical protein
LEQGALGVPGGEGVVRRSPRCSFCGSKKVVHSPFMDPWCPKCGVSWGRKGLSTFVELPTGTWMCSRQVPRGLLLVVDKASREEDW